MNECCDTVCLEKLFHVNHFGGVDVCGYYVADSENGVLLEMVI